MHCSGVLLCYRVEDAYRDLEGISDFRSEVQLQFCNWCTTSDRSMASSVHAA